MKQQGQSESTESVSTPEEESHVIALGMMGRMAVVRVDNGGSFSNGFQ